MFKNYIKTAWRNIIKHKLFSVLNIMGLAVGLSVSILLSLFIIQERSFDSFPNQELVYRYLSHFKNEDASKLYAGVPNAVGPAMKESLPEISFSARTLLNDFGENANITIEKDNYIENRLYWADPDITTIFDLNFIHGNRETALTEPNVIILSESKAKQYFGNANPIDKTIELDRNTTFRVTGVYSDLPQTSTFDAELIGSFSSTNFGRRANTWDNASFETWFMLENQNDIEKINVQLTHLLDQYMEKDKQYYTLSTQPLSEVHLYSNNIESYSNRKGDAVQLKQLSYLAIVLLLMAAINYINLATARAQQRSKEVGVNKTLGASRFGLIGKFYIETAVLTFLSVIVGLMLAIVGIPLFNMLSGKVILYEMLSNTIFWIGLPALWIMLTLIAGIYPAMILSSFRPIEALKSGSTQRIGYATLRRALVVVQFSASIILIVGVITMHYQMNYVSEKTLGYNPENVLAIGLNSVKSQGEFEALTNAIQSVNTTESTVSSQAIPGRGESGHTLYKNADDQQGSSLRTNRVIGDIGEVLELKLLSGRMVKKKHNQDTIVEVIVNKYALDYLSLSPDEAIGKKVSVGMGNHSYIVGVVDNFNYLSLHNPVGAYAFHNDNGGNPIRYLMVRFTTGDLRATLQQYEEVYKQILPDAPFDYTFLDSHLKSLYLADQKASSILFTFSLLAIFVGCLGLFGLSAFTIEKRIKEIGIRKVLGATVPSLLRLLSLDYIKLIVIAFIIAAPIALWGFSKWLDNFAYRIKMEWWMFALAGFGALMITLITVSSQAIRAAVANPVDSLRDE